MIPKRAVAWLHEPFDEETRREVKRLLQTGGADDAFFKDLSFGTGGMRGIMGVGTNRINRYTIAAATQGLANYLKKQGSVFIGYDVRHNSRLFAEITARVLAANGIRALITKDICQTPLVSYGCRHYGCNAAVMITASHNPPQYNGYKVYWADGGQIVPPHDEGIIAEVKRQTSYADVPLAPLDSKLISWVGNELDSAYLHELKKLQLYPAKPLHVVYTPLHGTGIRIIPQALKSWGYENVHLVEKQQTPDANFSHAQSPNPEEEKALVLGTEQLVKEHGDLLIATDPDADRMGVVVMHQGKPVRLTGNQIACVCLQHIAETLSERKQWPKNTACIKTIVTTELFRKIVERFGGTCVDVLTGFKYIGEQMTKWEKTKEHTYVFGAEESYGYLFGTMVRDKDAVSSACLVAEVAAQAKSENLTLVDKLHALYREYGVHREMLSQIAFSDSAAGMKEMQELMQKLRNSPPKTIGGKKVSAVEDYLAGTKLKLPKSDVLRFWLSDQSKLVIRPSGTEPKIKIYAEIVAQSDVVTADKQLGQLVEAFRAEVISTKSCERP